MKQKTNPLIIIMIFTLVLVACGASPTTSPISTEQPTSADQPTSSEQPTEIAPTLPPTSQPVSVVFVKDGDIKVWNEASGQSETLYASGDVISLSVSDDNQVIAFIRRSVVKISDLEWYEQSALWAVNRNGENPRQLLAAEDLRALLTTNERESSAFMQTEWVPTTHSLLFSGTKYIVQAEGLSHASPQGVFLVDADLGSNTALAGVDKNLRFAASPDGRQVALMSTTTLSFINTDGSSLRADVLTYPDMSLTASIFPTGVWTKDSQAFLITSFIESGTPAVMHFNLLRVPVDGSSTGTLASITQDSHPASVTYSPDGKFAAYYIWPDPAWIITPLAFEAGALEIPYTTEMSFANLNWSPSGNAFAINGQSLDQLCPNATRNTDVCGSPVKLEGTLVVIKWIDSSTFLYLTREPDKLFLGRLDGTSLLIVTWLTEEYPNSGSFSAVK